MRWDAELKKMILRRLWNVWGYLNMAGKISP